MENEIDHVFIGRYDGKVFPNGDEVEEIRWVSAGKLAREMGERPEEFTYWFRILMMRPEMKSIIQQMSGFEDGRR